MNYNEIRRKTREVRVGGLVIGGHAPIVIQSMTNTDTHDKEATLSQVLSMERAGCDMVRLTVPDEEAAETVLFLKEHDVHVPIVADIHFDYRIALRCAEYGVDKIRINPGNIGADEHVVKVVEKVRPSGIPIRIGINSGSLPEDILQEYGGHPTADGMVEGALRHIRILEKMDYRNMVISLKSSQVPLMIEAYEKLAEKVPYAFHLGVTEAGLARVGTIKSAIGIGTLLYKGIGDTIRVSLTDDPAEEIKVGQDILSALGLRQFGPVLISCPTCGRTQVHLIELAKEVEAALTGITVPLKIAVMGCVVNGPGEAREADFGIAGGNGKGIIFSHGQVLRTVPEDKLVDALLEEINKSISS